jgi:hypothetical protein
MNSLLRLSEPHYGTISENGEVALIVVGGSSWLRRLKIVPISVRNWFVWRQPITRRFF